MKRLIFLVFYLQIAAYDYKLPCLINKQAVHKKYAYYCVQGI